MPYPRVRVRVRGLGLGLGLAGGETPALNTMQQKCSEVQVQVFAVLCSEVKAKRII